VRAPAVDVEADAKGALGHGGALDVPAGPPAAPGRGPEGVLALLVRLPQREVEWVLLALGALEALALIHVLDAPVGEPAVARVGAHAKVDVAFGGIGVTGIDEGGDVVDDLLHALRRQRLVVGTAEAERARVGEVVGGHL